MKPVKIKFEKAVGAVRTYPVTELDENYNEVGVRQLKPGDECFVSHRVAHELTTALSAAFSAKDKIDMDVAAAEKRATDDKAAADQLDYLKTSARLEDQFALLVKRVEALEAKIAAPPDKPEKGKGK